MNILLFYFLGEFMWLLDFLERHQKLYRCRLFLKIVFQGDCDDDKKN